MVTSTENFVSASELLSSPELSKVQGSDTHRDIYQRAVQQALELQTQNRLLQAELNRRNDKENFPANHPRYQRLKPSSIDDTTYQNTKRVIDDEI